jgi:predicted metal-dependent HD superfamily phosphohydrolase
VTCAECGHIVHSGGCPCCGAPVPLGQWEPPAAGRPGAPLVRAWAGLGRRLGAPVEPWAREGAAILAGWREPHRRYHDASHLARCLRVFKPLRASAARPDMVELAIWLHDVVYDPTATDNEARSAAWGEHLLAAMGLPDDGHLSRMILATCHAAEPLPGDDALLVDIDLSVLGASRGVYARYARSVRAEYAFVPDDMWRVGRGRVLASFLELPRIFRTSAFVAYEGRARANLSWELSGLAVIVSP